MHGLINRTIENYLCDTYGRKFWCDVAGRLDAGFIDFEPMFQYDDALTPAVIDLAVQASQKPREALLEDLGTYLVTDPRAERVRRLLRFGGVDYVDFLHSLDDLHGRARLAVPDLNLPELEMTGLGDGSYSVACTSDLDGFGHVLVGLLRALADDYGALAVLDHQGRDGGREMISVQLLEKQFAQGRSFELATKAVAK